MLRRKIGIAGVVLLVLILPTIALASVAVYFSLVDDPEAIIVEELRRAEKSIDVAMYYFTNQAPASALVAAKQRGVAVRVYLDKSQKTEDIAGYLGSTGIALRISNNPNIMHDKFAVMDDRIVITGSYDWTKAAQTGNNENLLVIVDEEIGQRYSDEFNRLWYGHYLANIPQPKVTPSEIRAPPVKEDTVYITKMGKKYHRSGCSYLRQSCIPISRSEAIRRGYTFCSRCNP